jgi:hypothetical protein
MPIRTTPTYAEIVFVVSPTARPFLEIFKRNLRSQTSSGLCLKGVFFGSYPHAVLSVDF